jgi:hypothetical protein
LAQPKGVNPRPVNETAFLETVEEGVGRQHVLVFRRYVLDVETVGARSKVPSLNAKNCKALLVGGKPSRG